MSFYIYPKTRIPKIAVAEYCLLDSNKKRENLVASPKQIGKRPLAIGSRLPQCPALRALNKDLTYCNAVFEVIFFGLSNSKMP